MIRQYLPYWIIMCILGWIIGIVWSQLNNTVETGCYNIASYVEKHNDWK